MRSCSSVRSGLLAPLRDLPSDDQPARGSEPRPDIHVRHVEKRSLRLCKEDRNLVQSKRGGSHKTFSTSSAQQDAFSENSCHPHHHEMALAGALTVRSGLMPGAQCPSSDYFSSSEVTQARIDLPQKHAASQQAACPIIDSWAQTVLLRL